MSMTVDDRIDDIESENDLYSNEKAIVIEIVMSRNE
jgi:hypothetical protein